MRRVIEYLHKHWPNTIIELRGDSHFASHDFMDWAHDKWYVRYTTGLSGNPALFRKIEKQLRRAESDYKRKSENQKRANASKSATGRTDFDTEHIVIRRYYKMDYKASTWKFSQRVIAKIEINPEGSNVRFVVTKNKNNSPQHIYKQYCMRGKMELWIKDMKYFKADRMSCNSYRANYFRLFLYAAAFVLAHKIKHTVFNGTEVEHFTMDSLMKRIMLSAVYISERKTYIKISFSPHHRHLEEMAKALERMAA